MNDRPLQRKDSLGAVFHHEKYLRPIKDPFRRSVSLEDDVEKVSLKYF